MKRSTQYSSRLILLAFTMILLLAGGCKSKKKAMEAAAAAEKAKMEQEAALRKQRDEEERKKSEAEAADRARREAQAEADARAKAASSTPAVKLRQYFDAISSANSPESANNSIKEALALFATDDTPVLIVISESGGQKDYDRPTTIKTYLNYLKDQKKNINPVSNLEFDAAGKITSVELRKQN